MRFSLEVADVDDPQAFARLVAEVLGLTLAVEATVHWVIPSTRERSGRAAR